MTRTRSTFRPMFWGIAALAVVLLMGRWSPTVRADEASEKKAAALLDKYIEATGGQAAYDAIKTRTVKADVSVPAVGMNAKMELYSETPDKFYTVIQTAAGNMERGWNGDVVWMVIPGLGARILEGAEKVAVIGTVPRTGSRSGAICLRNRTMPVKKRSAGSSTTKLS